MSDKKSSTFWDVIKWLGIVAGIIIALFYFDDRIDDRIDKKISEKLKDAEVIRQIAPLVRPSLTFDHNGTIRSDSGGEQFIKHISVEFEAGEPSQIIIYPKEHLNSAPILECINDNFDVTHKRINKSDWLFELSGQGYLIMADSQKKKEWLFRLEIIK